MAFSRDVEQVVNFVAFTIKWQFIGFLLVIGVIFPALAIIGMLKGPEVPTYSPPACPPAPAIPAAVPHANGPAELTDDPRLTTVTTEEREQYRRWCIEKGFLDPEGPEAQRIAGQWTTQ